jgi:hypothetical protein
MLGSAGGQIGASLWTPPAEVGGLSQHNRVPRRIMSVYAKASAIASVAAPARRFFCEVQFKPRSADFDPFGPGQSHICLCAVADLYTSGVRPCEGRSIDDVQSAGL